MSDDNYTERPPVAMPTFDAPSYVLTPGITPATPGLKPKQADLLFPNQRMARTWSERLTYQTGTAYLGGLAVGGGYGFVHGVRQGGRESFKLRMNSVLNGMSRYGPKLGNSLGVMALMFSCLDGAMESFRGEEDIINPVTAAAATGLLYKSTSGVKLMGIYGLGLGVGVAGAKLATGADMPSFMSA